MTNKEFISKLLDITNKPTVYAMGTYGQVLTVDLLERLVKTNPNKWYTDTRAKTLTKNIGKVAYDCSGLIKGVIFGKLDATNDFNADTIIKKCSNVSKDFTNIEVGEAVHLKGHIGVYIGDGKVVESTPKWKNGVQITELSARKWIEHGRLEFYGITYDSIMKPAKHTAIVNTVSSNLNVRKGASVRYSVVGQFKKGATITILDNTNTSWYLCEGVGINGQIIKGYCFAKYIKGVC